MILDVLAAMAEPTRLRAMLLLKDGSEHCVCELMEKLDATQSRMSRHMKTLKQAGLVVDRRDAQWVRFRLNPNMPPEIWQVVDATLKAADVQERKVA